MKTRAYGFTLIELMIAVAAVAILSAFAYPSYINAMQRTNRGDANAMLNRLATEQERFFATNRTYTTDASLLGQDASTVHSTAGHYQMSIAAGPTGDIRTSFLLTATADSDIQKKDTSCASFSLDSTGTRAPNPATSDCW